MIAASQKIVHKNYNWNLRQRNGAWFDTRLGEVSHSRFTTDGRSLSLSWRRAPSGTLDQILVI